MNRWWAGVLLIIAVIMAARPTSNRPPWADFNAFRAYPRFAEAYRRQAAGDLVGARAKLREGLAIQPGHAHARATLAMLAEPPVHITKPMRTVPVVSRSLCNFADSKCNSVRAELVEARPRAQQSPPFDKLRANGENKNTASANPYGLAQADIAPSADPSSLPNTPALDAPAAMTALAGWQVANAGYAAKAQGDFPAARIAFEKALAMPDLSKDQRLALSRELAWLNQWWSLDAYALIRSQSPDLAQLAASAGQLGGSQAGMTAAIRLNGNPAQPLALTTRLTAALGDRGDRSIQSAFGLRWQPMRHVNAVIGAERLVKIGADARDAWAVRAAWGTGQGYTQPPGRDQWTTWSLYAEGAAIGAHRRDLAVSAEAMAGRSFQWDARWSVTPRLVGVAQWQHADRGVSLIEAGPGLALGYRLASDTTVQLRIDYRWKLGGNAASADGVVGSIAIGF